MNKTRKLNSGQLDVLKTLYKFRFGTRELIAVSLGKKNSTSIYSRLSILEEQGHVGKRFKDSYKLAGKPAEYYLTPKGLKTLKEASELDGLDDKAIKASYKDKTASDQFISKSLITFNVANKLSGVYPGLQFFTKRELTAYDYFPKPLPDGFIAYKQHDRTSNYLLGVFLDNEPLFTITSRLKQLSSYYESGEWDVTNLDFPIILFICSNSSLEKFVSRQVKRVLYNLEEEISFYSTTLKAAASLATEDKNIWTNCSDEEELLSIEEMI
jgi:DNA-binding PadR family transcriptional regulator